MSLIVMPDAKGLTLDYLAGLDDVRNVVNRSHDDGVYGEYPSEGSDGTSIGLPMIVVSQVGSIVVVKRWFNKVTLQLDVYGDYPPAGSEQQVQDVAAVAQAAIFNMTGVHPTAVVTAVREVVGPSYMPDPDSTRPRNFSRYDVTLHPLPDIAR